MTNEKRLRSMEASFKMEDRPFDSSCRKRVRNVLNNTTTVADAIEELNRKYGVSKRGKIRNMSIRMMIQKRLSTVIQGLMF